jgi:hypothetical protein
MKKVNFSIPATIGKLLQKVAESIVVVVVATLLLSGCALHNAIISSSSAPFYLVYDSDEVIRDQSQVATITSTGGLEIDGVVVNSKKFRSAHTSRIKSSVVVADILPGIHSVKVLYNPEGKPISVNPIIYNFEAGKIYDIALGIAYMFVKENTSASVAQKIATNRNKTVFETKK